ncbi:MAG: transporter [Deferrisomatales bacterium]|nr:transporter [Deferrisomatales bacterium]
MIRVPDTKLARLPFGLALLGVWLAVVIFWSPSSVHAQALEPRAYSNVPVGVNFALAGYIYGQGGLSVDPSVPLEDARIDTHTGLVAGARSVGFWGNSGMLSLLVPYTELSGTAVVAGAHRSRYTQGFGDPLMKVSVNLVGAPALALKEFAAYRQDLILGVSLLVSAPLGEYDASKAVNIGANRWSFKPEVGISKALGKWTVEGAGAVTLFTDNHDFYGGQTREQEPIYSAQGHVIYSFLPGLWAALNAT